MPAATEQNMIDDARGAPREGDDPRPDEILVMGGGISGLALGVWLQEEGFCQTHIADVSDRPGGVIDSLLTGGFMFERGPNTILDKTESFNDLLDVVGLADAAIRVPLAGQARYVWFAGRLHEVPSGPGSLLKSKLLTAGAKLRLLKEPFVKPDHEDEPLADFVRRRLGREVYERMFIPVVQGVGAGDPERMSTEASFPILKELEREHGSVIRGFIKNAKADRKARGGAPRPARHMVSFPAGENGGLARLPVTMASRIGKHFHKGFAAERIEKTDTGWRVYPKPAGNGFKAGEWERLAICTPAAQAADLIEPFDADLAADLRAVHYCPMVTVGLGVEKDSLPLPPGFGFLTVPGQGVRVLGSIFNSNFFPDRAPEGCHALTAMLGGDLRPDDVAKSDAEIEKIIREDFKTIFGADLKIRALRIARWERAIPQYGLDHPALQKKMERFEAAHPGLYLCGNWRDGVSITDRIDRARALARAIAEDAKSRKSE